MIISSFLTRKQRYREKGHLVAVERQPFGGRGGRETEKAEELRVLERAERGRLERAEVELGTVQVEGRHGSNVTAEKRERVVPSRLKALNCQPITKK